MIQDALARKVDEHRFLLKLGESQIEAKQCDEAEKSLRRALEKKPKLDTARFNLGLVYEEKGQFDQAIAAYEAELAEQPEGLSRRLQPREAAAEGGPARGGGGATSARRSSSQPDFGTGQLYLAKALLDAGDLKGAEQWAREGLTHKPEPNIAPLGHYVLADVYNRQGREAEAEREVAAAERLQRGG